MQKEMADCVNSSPPLISRKFQGFGGIWANPGKFGKFRENSGEFSGIQWVFFCMVLSMNSVGIPGGFRATPDFREKFWFGVVSGDLGGQKAFAQIARRRCFFVSNRNSIAIEDVGFSDRCQLRAEFLRSHLDRNFDRAI